MYYLIQYALEMTQLLAKINKINVTDLNMLQAYQTDLIWFQPRFRESIFVWMFCI